jgi:hypothetical protein
MKRKGEERLISAEMYIIIQTTGFSLFDYGKRLRK